MMRTVSSITTLSSSAPRDEVVESRVSFPASTGEDGRGEPESLAGITSGPSSSSEITIAPSWTGVKRTSVVVGISGPRSPSSRCLMAVATPAVVRGAEVVGVVVRSFGELSGEPNVVRRSGDLTSRSRGAGRLETTSCSTLGRWPERGIGGGALIDPLENVDILEATENREYR